MEKRYQVFVSSTYADLKDERQKVIQTLMEMDCIPAGMELFPAADEEQWNFIKKIIDDCDYYVLIIGGRYGSLTRDGISYTEKEFEYALSKGIRVIALVHEAPDEIAVGKSDITAELRAKLNAFRDKVRTGRLVKMWRTAAELPGIISLSLQKTIKTYPAIGWVRGNSIANNDVLNDLNTLRKEKEAVERKLMEVKKETTLQESSSLAGLNENFKVRVTYTSRSQKYKEEIEATWAEIFAIISPDLVGFPSDGSVNFTLGRGLLFSKKDRERSAHVIDEDFKTIRVQFKALGLVTQQYTKTTNGAMGLFWGITNKGERAMVDLRTVKTVSPTAPTQRGPAVPESSQPA